MNDTRAPRHLGRSIVAVLAGMLASIVVITLTDIVLHAAGVFAPWGQPNTAGPLLLAIAYRAFFGVAASYLTARIAPDRPLAHAMAGGLVGLVLGIVGAAVTWNRGPAFGPHWYPLALIIIALPCAWLGGTFCEMQLRPRIRN
jgi:hypothetical protein